MSASTKCKRIIIDPRSSYAYGSFYLYGLINLFGRTNVHFSIKPFRELPDVGWNFRFIAVNGDEITKYYVHTDDSWKIHETDYKWCDVYGSVNANFKETPKEKYPKLVSLVPSFGICAMSDSKAFWMAIDTFLSAMPIIVKRQEWNKYKNKMDRNVYKNIKHHFGKIYKTQKKRMPYSSYVETCDSLDDYIFFCSTLWYDNPDNQNDKGVNLHRAIYMRTCKSLPNIKFEGGFVADSTSSKEKFADLLTNGVEVSEWMRKTKLSALVFNTPAFWNCHGWKLGEYLALGKCIISTPLSNDLPAPLEHGVHIHYVEPNEESIREAVEYIVSHKEYRKTLERNAKAYWDRYGTPEQSLHLLGL